MFLQSVGLHSFVKNKFLKICHISLILTVIAFNFILYFFTTWDGIVGLVDVLVDTAECILYSNTKGIKEEILLFTYNRDFGFSSLGILKVDIQSVAKVRLINIDKFIILSENILRWSHLLSIS